MYFQISPVKKAPKVKKVVTPKREEVSTIILEAFSSIPKLCFEDVIVGTSRVIKLIVVNPKTGPVEVEVLFCGPTELDFCMSWCDKMIEQSSSSVLDLMWSPTEVYSGRHQLKIVHQKQYWSIPISFKATAEKVSKSKCKTVTTLVKKSKTLARPKPTLKRLNQTFSPNKENEKFVSPSNVVFTSSPGEDTRRCTYTVHNPRVKKSPDFHDSLENESPSPASNRSVLKPMHRNVNYTSDDFPFPSPGNDITPQRSFIPKTMSTVEVSKNNDTRVLYSNFQETAKKLDLNQESFQTDACNLAKLHTADCEKNLLLSANWIPQSRQTVSPILSKKRKPDATFILSPMKRPNIKLENWSKTTVTLNQPKTIERKIEISKTNGTGGVLSTETKTLLIKDPFILAATSSVDPFLSSITLDGEWIAQQELRFKNWFNMLLTPPEFNDTAETTVEIEKVWRDSANKTISSAPTKEKICYGYNEARLNGIRKAFQKLLESEEMQSVLNKISQIINDGKLEIRQDKNIHLDINLQGRAMSLIMCYSPLWLRFGLETLYKEKLQLSSNCDVAGLHKFLSERFFKDPRLLRKHKTIYVSKYTTDIKKFILQKFLHLVYLLDIAKQKMLIRHNPCLFRKNAPFKESREMLLQFSLDLVTAGVGDITKYLKHHGYVVSYKQNYIDEYDFAVKNLGGDLRDGVRLTRIAELILLRSGLMQKLRVPAISKLQKVHNVKIVFEALSEAGFRIQHDIEPYHIVEGHREKTLSFLWQIVYKIETPFVIKSVSTVQTWWRSLPVILKRNKLRRIYEERVRAATVIQRIYRRRCLADKLLIYAKNMNSDAWKREKAALVIQRCFRKFIQNKRRKSAVVIQKYVRGFLARSRFLALKRAVLCIEQHYIAQKLMIVERQRYCELKTSAINVQKRYRAKLAMKLVRNDYLLLKKTVCFVQKTFRNNQLTKRVRNDYQRKKCAAIVIQKWYRAAVMMRVDRNNYLKMKTSVLCIESHYLAYKEMKKNRDRFIELKITTVMLQRRFRANKQMLEHRNYYRSLRKAAIFTQTQYRLNKLAKAKRQQFLLLKEKVVFIQRIFRANVSMKIERQHFLKLKTATIVLQSRFRAHQLMKICRNDFLAKQRACIVIQKKLRDYQRMKSDRENFLKKKESCLVIQRKFRALLQMRRQRDNYSRLKVVTIKIQQTYRAKKVGRNCRQDYLKLKHATIFIQQKYRGNKLMERQRASYLKQRNAAVTIQQYFRGYLEMKKCRATFVSKINACKILQTHFRAKKLGRICRSDFLKLKNATTLVQEKYRAKRLMKIQRASYLKQKEASIKIQRYFRGYREMKRCRATFVATITACKVIQKRYKAKKLGEICRSSYLKLRTATIFVQKKFIDRKLMRIQRASYLEQRTAIIKIQRYFRGYLEMKKCRATFVATITACKLIQKRFRAKKQGETCRSNYLKLKTATTFVQRRYRANRAMEKQRSCYLKHREAAIKIQRYFRGYIEMKKSRSTFRSTTFASKTLQKYIRGYLVRKKYGSMLTAEAIEQRRLEKTRGKAVVKLQAWWRGCRQRLRNDLALKKIRERCIKAQENACPENTLESRGRKALNQFENGKNLSISYITSIFRDFEFVTRRSDVLCLKLAPILGECLYAFIISAIRSLPEMEMCIAATMNLVNLCKYRCTMEMTWQPQHLDNVLNTMMNWCDKEQDAFPALCTLLWLFAHKQEYKTEIRGIPLIQVRLNKMRTAILRKQKMVLASSKPLATSKFLMGRSLPLPNLEPDWGFDYVNKPRIFTNSVQGINCLMQSLDL